MRTTVSTIVIVLCLAVIGAGYFSGRSSVPVPQIAAPRPSPQNVAMPAPAAFERTLRGAHSLDLTDETPRVQDDAVVAGDPSAGSLAEDATIALVLGGAGRSLKLEEPFLDLPVPLTVIVDPDADDAQAVAAAAFERGKLVYIRLPERAMERAATLRAAVERTRTAFAPASGFAVRFDRDGAHDEAALLAAALHGTGFAVLDMTGAGPLARATLARAGVHVRRRDVTIDGREESAYVKFMLAQAVQVARGRGTAVVVAHPYPQSLAALSALVRSSDRTGVNFTRL